LTECRRHPLIRQPHRAELATMLVHRRARRRGLGRALFATMEAEATSIFYKRL
jgi:GNAT superfamily N-acetyltransferase